MIKYILLIWTIILTATVANAGTYNYASTDFIQGGTASVERNWIKNSGLETNTIGWAAYSDTPNPSQPPLPIDGTGGSPTVTCTRTTSTPLAGSGSLLITKDAANRQGQGCSYAFTIDNGQQTSVQTISFGYSPASGTYSGGTSSTDSDIEVYIYDVTNATVIQPAGYKIDGAVNGSYYKSAQVTFQTANNSTSYRLIFNVATTSASAYTMKLDEIKVGPQNTARGPPVTDWVSYTPTVTHDSGGITNATHTGKWRRVGDSIEVYVQTVFSNTSAAFGGLYYGLPSGLTADSTKFPGASVTIPAIGTASMYDTSTKVYGPVSVVWGGSAASLRVNTIDTATTANPTRSDPPTNTYPFTFNNTDTITAEFTVPILGWSSSVLMSSDASTSVVAFSGQKSAAQSGISGSTRLTYGTVSVEKGLSYASATGLVTVQVPGTYRVYGSLQFESVASGEYVELTVYKNTSSAQCDALNYATQTTHWLDVDCVRDYVAGDTIEIKSNSNSATYDASSGSRAQFMVTRISGPSQIAASETVAARYYVSASTANTSFADDSPEIVDADTKIYDTHGAVTTGAAWKFTAPVAGKYHVCIRQRWANGTNLADTDGFLYKNGASYAGVFGSPTASVYDHNGCVTVNTVAGDYLQWYASQNDSAAGARNITTTGNAFIDIYRIGN